MSTEPIATLNSLIARLEYQEDRLRSEIDELEERLEAARISLSGVQGSISKLRAAQTDLSKVTVPVVDLEINDSNQANGREIGTHFQRVKAFLESEHEPQTIVEIEAGTGIPRTSITAVLYRTHKDEFVHHEIPSKRGKAWRLKDEPFCPPPASADEKDIPF
jgi:hypothetical protein